MDGASLSTSNGPKGPAGADVFPAISLTVTAGIVALFVSVFGGTFVCTLNEEGPASPEPLALSLAVQGTSTSLACHAAVGGVQLTVGAVRSVFIVKVGVAVLTLLPLFVTCVSTTFELSVAA